MTILWRPQLTTGDERIDQDHKYLFCIFNCLELALGSSQTRSIPLFFAQLLDYTAEHFAREEVLQIEIRYPHYKEHKAEHERILTKLTVLHDRLQQLAAIEDEVARAAAMHAQLDQDIMNLARSWIVDHVVRMDTDMRPYLKHQAAAHRDQDSS